MKIMVFFGLYKESLRWITFEGIHAMLKEKTYRGKKHNKQAHVYNLSFALPLELSLAKHKMRYVYGSPQQCGLQHLQAVVLQSAGGSSSSVAECGNSTRHCKDPAEHPLLLLCRCRECIQLEQLQLCLSTCRVVRCMQHGRARVVRLHMCCGDRPCSGVTHVPWG